MYHQKLFVEIFELGLETRHHSEQKKKKKWIRQIQNKSCIQIKAERVLNADNGS